MKIIEQNEIVQTVLAYVCDSCQTEFEDAIDIQEFLHYRNHAGYGSVFGDGAIMSLDLCQNCVKKLLGDFIQFHGEESERHDQPRIKRRLD